MKAHRFPDALILYVIFFLALTFPYWLRGEVIAPYRQAAEIGATEIANVERSENRKFADYVNGYIPEINNHLKGKRSGWLTLWTNQNELGRPLYHISGFSPAYLPSWLIAQFTSDPHRFITFLSLGTCFLSGIFVLLLCHELQLAPLAGLLVAGSLSTSPLLMYWLTFPMFPSIWCWAAGALYGVTRLVRKVDLLGWSVLAFSVYSLLMTAYPQPVVFHAYILSGYVACLTFRCWQRTGWLSTIRYLAIAAIAVGVGVLLALPVYLDLVHTASESARVAPDISFFTGVLPKIDSFTAALRFLSLSTFPEIFGNPIASSYPFPYDGLSLTPLIVFLALAGLVLRFRQTWGWWLAMIVLLMLAFIHPLYAFAVKYLGFNLSRSNPTGSLMLPLTVVAAYGADALIRRVQTNRHSWTVVWVTLSLLLGLLVAVVYGLGQGLDIRWGIIAMTLLVISLLAAQFDRPRPTLLIAALLAVGIYLSFPLMLRQEPAQIATSSPLLEKIRDNLPPDSRYAVISPGLAVLQPNLNATLGLNSVHTYNSLSSRRYHALIQSLGGEVLTYGRWNGAISPDYDSPLFWMSNISLLLSPTRLTHENLAYLEQVNGVHLYHVESRMGCCLQVALPLGDIGPEGVQISNPRGLRTSQPVKAVDKGDLLEFDVEDGQASLLILSQKFHRDWSAKALTSSGWTKVKTVPVNGVFQGILLPLGAQKVQLRFEPWVRFAWIAHIVWLIVLMTLIYQLLSSNVPRLLEKKY